MKVYIVMYEKDNTTHINGVYTKEEDALKMVLKLEDVENGAVWYVEEEVR